MIFKSSSEYVLLGILMTDPKHGYEVNGYFSSKMNQFWHLSISQVYSLLNLKMSMPLSVWKFMRKHLKK
jgi:DNA-binding PadR family transcriptional regulator